MVKVGLIPQIITLPPAMELPSHPQQRRFLFDLHNYDRVLTPDNKLVEHIAYLKQQRGIPKQENFSTWDVYSCTGLYLKSYLEQHGVEVLLINYIDADNQEVEFKRLQDFEPDILVVSTTNVLTPFELITAGKMIRQYLPDVFLVAGGAHLAATLQFYNHKQKCNYLRKSKFDVFIEDNQGEQALLGVIQSLPNSLEGINNLIWKDAQGEFVINRRVPEKNRIDETLINFKGIKPGSPALLRTASGCSFRCAFCSYCTRGTLRLMKVDDAIAMLKRAKEAGVGSVIFIDDTFNVPRKRFEQLLDRMIAEDINLPWSSFLRCQFVDENIVKKMKQSGCRGVFLGIESGSDEMLKNMNKGSAVQAYRNGIKWLKEQGIITLGGFIVGFPGETAETLAKTVDFLETAGLDFYFLQIFYYLHHTLIHKQAARYQLVGEGDKWVHATMNADEAKEAIARIFMTVKNTTFVNPIYNFWEIAYLQNKGFDLPAIRQYKYEMNQMTARQMQQEWNLSLSPAWAA